MDKLRPKILNELRFYVHGDGSGYPAWEKYRDRLGLVYTTLEPKHAENKDHNDGHRDPPTYEFIHKINSVFFHKTL